MMSILSRPLRIVMLAAAYAAFCTGGDIAVAFDKAAVDARLAAIADYDSKAGTAPLLPVEQIIRDSQNDPDQRKYIELRLCRMLESDITIDAKQFICAQLWFIGTADSVPAVARLLLDEQTADMACYAIGQNSSPEAGRALREALDRVPPAVRIRVVNLLGDRCDRQSIEALGKLVFGVDADAAEAAAAALGKIGGPRAGKILAEARVKGDAGLKFAATDAYLRCAEDLAADGNNAEAVEIYRELAAEGQAPFVRSAAVKGLADYGGPDVVALVVAALRDKDRMVRTTARGCVRTMKGDGVTQRFAAELPGSSAADRVLLLGALADRRDPAALPAVTEFTRDENVEVRKAALLGLGKLGDDSAVELLVKAAAQGTTSEEKNIALNSLEILRGERVDDAIVESMNKSEVDVRVALIKVLYNRNAAGAAAALLRQARDSDARIRRAAFRALGRLAAPEHLPSLVRLLVDMPEASGRREAERAIVAVSRRIADQDRSADVLLGALAGEKRSDARCSLLRALGAIANARSLAAVADALKESSPKVRDTAVRELAAWPNPAAARAVLTVFLGTQDRTHRLLSLRGLVRMLNLPSQRPAEETLAVYAEVMTEMRGPDEKKLVLSGLAKISHPRALEMVLQYLDEQPVRAEAALATVSIARGVCGSRREQAEAAAKDVLAAAPDEAVRARAREIIAVVTGLGDYVTAWKVTGPYAELGKNHEQLFDIPFGPEKPGGTDVLWSLMPVGLVPERPWLLELSQMFPGQQQAAYLLTWIHSPAEQKARLEMGADDGIKVCLNDAVVYANNVSRTLVPASDKADVTLRQGWNRLLVKVTHDSGAWQFCARLRSPDGRELQDVRIDCMHPGD